MSIFLATYDSRNFSFMAAGDTEQQAREALVKGLRAHAHEYSLPDKNWFSIDDINIDELQPGVAYRDHSEIQMTTVPRAVRRSPAR